MALTIPNLQSSPTFDAQSDLDTTDWAANLASETGTGVVSGMLCSPNTGMTISIAAGTFIISGIEYTYAGGTGVATIGAASTYDRKDIVSINAAGTITVTAGTPGTVAGWTRSSSALPPVKPSIPASNVILCEVYVASTTTTIATGNIVDKTTLCNPVLPSLGSAGQVAGVNAAANGLQFRSATPTTIPTALQSLTASSDNILTGGVVALSLGDIYVGMCVEWDVQLIKTAAGTSTWSMYVRVGTTTAGATSDTAVATWTSGTNTAAIDQSSIRVKARCTSITSGSATFACAAFAQNELTTATGLGLFASPIPGSTATVTVSTAQSIHLDITPGASAVMTAATFVTRAG